VSTPVRAPLRAFARRRVPRCELAVPVRVTVMRSGTAYSIPGRSVDLGEGGIAVVLAGEVRVADAVGVEFLLPELGLGLQTKAAVRHHSPLRCGFEFKELTRHQQAVIREWARQRLQTRPDGRAANSNPAERTTSAPLASRRTRDQAALGRFFWLVAGVLALAGLLAWWHWQIGWRELERRIPRPVGQVTTVAPTYSLANSETLRPLNPLASRPGGSLSDHPGPS
jgi:PilZ domain